MTMNSLIVPELYIPRRHQVQMYLLCGVGFAKYINRYTRRRVTKKVCKNRASTCKNIVFWFT
jgi:hypothetical protein